MAKIQNNDNTKCWQECRAKRTLTPLLVEIQNSTATLEDTYKLNILLPCNPAIEILGIYSIN